MQIEIEALTPNDLEEFGTVPISLTYHSRFRVEWVDQGTGGIHLTEEKLPEPIRKDFDAERGQGPERWRSMFGDISHWGIFGAYAEGRIVGGVAVAHATPSMGLLEGRDDLASLVNIRVDPDYRTRGIGGTLFRQAVSFATMTPCKRMKIQTQNTNVTACRFYARQGCRLESIDPLPEDPSEFEVDLIFYLDLTGKRSGDS